MANKTLHPAARSEVHIALTRPTGCLTHRVREREYKIAAMMNVSAPQKQCLHMTQRMAGLNKQATPLRTINAFLGQSKRRSAFAGQAVEHATGAIQILLALLSIGHATPTCTFSMHPSTCRRTVIFAMSSRTDRRGPLQARHW